MGTARPSYAAEPTPAADASRAGSRAGEGRERPGRPGVDVESGEAEADDPPDTEPGTATGSTPPGQARPTGGPHTPRNPGAFEPRRPGAATEPSQDAALSDQEAGGETIGRHDAVEEPVLRVLPLGSGLILIGLGLGLAFVALRVRRS
jgi:hypothetical protein